MKKAVDLFMTNELIAKKCIEFLEKKVGASQRKIYLEPSAGTGNFSKNLTDCVSVDIAPQSKEIIKADFLQLNFVDLFPNGEKKENICVIGNPPFGKNSSLAVRFFNQAAEFGDVVAFIVPKTFKKDSLQRKLNRHFWLIGTMDIPKNSFTLENTIQDTPSIFQIWERRKKRRSMPTISLDNKIFEFVKNPEDSDVSVRRVGGRAGKAMLNVLDCAVVSHYFLKIKDKTVNKHSLVEIINAIDFSEVANSTAGVRSISKSEFVQSLSKVFDLY